MESARVLRTREWESKLDGRDCLEEVFDLIDDFAATKFEKPREPANRTHSLREALNRISGMFMTDASCNIDSILNKITTLDTVMAPEAAAEAPPIVAASTIVAASDVPEVGNTGLVVREKLPIRLHDPVPLQVGDLPAVFDRALKLHTRIFFSADTLDKQLDLLEKIADRREKYVDEYAKKVKGQEKLNEDIKVHFNDALDKASKILSDKLGNASTSNKRSCP